MYLHKNSSYKSYMVQYTSERITFLLRMNTNPTRTNGLKIYKHHCIESLRRYSFSQRIIDHWNRLPSEIVNASNLLSFKTQLDIFK